MVGWIASFHSSLLHHKAEANASYSCPPTLSTFKCQVLILPQLLVLSISFSVFLLLSSLSNSRPACPSGIQTWCTTILATPAVGVHYLCLFSVFLSVFLLCTCVYNGFAHVCVHAQSLCVFVFTSSQWETVSEREAHRSATCTCPKSQHGGHMDGALES